LGSIWETGGPILKDIRGLVKAEREFHRRFENRHKAAPITCAACGRRVTRKARQQLYCSDRCRQYALRENKARTAIKNASGYQDRGPVTNPHFLSNKNNELQGPKSGSSIPLNVLGGHRWSNAIPVDRDLLRKVVRAELGST
jgi:endogenous inhibitor of DNA gyrase (YacG/DUF329 family)